jgi:predicted Fe-Mo cluster-binding NifX family protein
MVRRYYMSYNIAISSTDGKVVNEHFGRTKRFLIVKVLEDNSYEFLEAREVNPICKAAEHDDNALEAAVAAISDCKYVLCSQIGMGAQNALTLHGIISFSIGIFIEDAIRYLIKFNSKKAV